MNSNSHFVSEFALLPYPSILPHYESNQIEYYSFIVTIKPLSCE